MANIFLTENDTDYRLVNNDDQVFGAAGTESVVVEGTGIQLDSNVESSSFNNAAGEYTFKQAGNTMEVYDGDTLVASVPVGENGATASFNGEQYDVILSADGMTLGEATLPTDTATTVDPGTGTTEPTDPPVNGETFTLTAGSASVNEGDSVDFNIADATGSTEYTYTISGVSASDVESGSLTGTVTTQANGSATFSVELVEDALTEGVETLTVTIGENTADVTVNDTSVDQTGETYNLTDERDIVTTTENNDTINAGFGTLGATDIITDSETTDNDTLDAVIDANSATTFTAVNIENINMDVRATTNETFDLVNTSGLNKLTLLSNYSIGANDWTVDNIESGTEVDVQTSMNLGAGDVLTITASEDADDSAATVTLNGDDFTLATQSAATDDIDLLTINSVGDANEVTLNADNSFTKTATNDESITLTGDQDLTLKVTDGTLAVNNLAVVDNLTGDAVSTLAITKASEGTAEDLTNANVDVISLLGDIAIGDSFVVNSGARFDLDSDFSDGTDAVDLDVSTTDTNSNITINLDTTNTSNGANNAGITLSEFNTVNIANTTSAATTLEGDIDLSVAGIGETTDLNIDTGDSAGITIAGTISASQGTLETVTVTGASAYVSTGAVTADEVVATSTHDQEFTGGITGNLTSTIAEDRTLTIGATDVAGDVTVDGAGDATFGAAITGSTNFTNEGDVSITTDLGDASTDTHTVAIGGDLSVTDDIIGTADITLTDSGVADNDELTVTNVTGDLTLSGSGDANISGDVTGDLTVGGSVNATVAGDVQGDLTVTGSGDVTVTTALDGSLIAGSATGDIDIRSDSSQSGSITTGSGDDSIVLDDGDNPVTVSTGAGNDTIDAEDMTDAVSINGGAGNDSINGGELADELTGGYGTDTFIYDDIGDAGANEVIKDFTTGSSGDILDVDADTFGVGLKSDGFSVSEIDTTDEDAEAIDNGDVLLLSGTGYTDENAALTAINGSSGVNTLSNDDSVMAIYYDTTDEVSYVIGFNDTDSNASNDGVFDAVEVLVQLENIGLADIANFNADNFTIA